MKHVLKHEKSAGIENELKDNLKSQEWRYFSYEIELSLGTKLSKVKELTNHDNEERRKISASFTFLHLLILCKDIEILNHVTKIHSASLVDEVGRPVKIESSKKISPKSVVWRDNWIFDANCLHLAAKFMPHGLKLLISNLDETLNIGKLKKTLIRDYS